jgi:hypothetical protein
MAAIKKSVRLVDNTAMVCRVVSRVSRNSSDNDVNWSGSINALADEYTVIMDENKPELSEKKWLALYCVYNGYVPSEDAQREARLLSWHISEGYQYDEQVRDALGSEEEAVAFIEQIKEWSITTQLSAIYHAKKFWSKC